MEQEVTTQEIKPVKKENKVISFVFEAAKIIILALVIVLPIRYYLFQPFVVKGDSMIPNFQTGNYLIVDEISYRFKAPERGDVVVLKYPLQTTERFIKRIIGLPGETIQVQDGKVVVTENNGSVVELIEKSYLPNLKATNGNIKITLKDNEYFVLGDNRNESYDSRSWGVLPKDDIVGRAFLRLFPINEIGKINTPSYK